MRKYRGLFLREILISRKTIIVGVIAGLLIVMYGVLIGLSTRYGNLRNISEDARFMLTMSKYMFVLLTGPIIQTVISPVNSVTADRKCGWQKYRYTLPISTGEFIRFSYCTMLIVMLLSIVTGMILSSVILASFGERLTIPYILIIVFTSMLIFMTQSMSLPLNMLTNSTDISGIFTVILMYLPFVPVGIVFYIKNKRFLTEHGVGKLEELPDELNTEWQNFMLSYVKDLFSSYWWVIVLYIAVIAIAGILLTKKLYDRRVC